MCTSGTVTRHSDSRGYESQTRVVLYDSDRSSTNTDREEHYDVGNGVLNELQHDSIGEIIKDLDSYYSTCKGGFYIFYCFSFCGLHSMESFRKENILIVVISAFHVHSSDNTYILYFIYICNVFNIDAVCICITSYVYNIWYSHITAFVVHM